MPRAQRAAAAIYARRDSLLVLQMRGAQRAPNQNRQDDREDEHFLIRAPPEGGKGLDQADAERGKRGDGVTREPADNRGDEALEADQEAAVVIDRCDRRDENAGDRAD